jgi:tetratricopeptide (TPR) repeat protein
MSEGHLSRDLVQRFFRSELSGRDNRAVLHHLIRHCDECLAVAIEVGAEEGYIYQDGDFRSALFPDGAERYHETFLEVLGSADDARLELARERLRGIGLWHALEKQDQVRRLEMIRDDPRMHTWGLYDRLLEKSREMGFRAPGYAAEIADLALAVVDTLDLDSHGAVRIADLRAGALGALGNARRLASNFAGAEKAFRQAQGELSRGTGAPSEQARLFSFQASLHKDLGDFERAMEILDRVIALYQDLQDPHLQGRALLQQADTIGYTNPERAIELVQDGLALIDPQREPRLEWCGRHALTLFLNDAGRPREALTLLELSRPLYEQFQDPWTRIRLHWLEGKIARSLGDLAEAEETFKRLWYDLQDPAYAHELTLLSIDLAEVYVAREKHEEALELVEEFGPMLQEWGMHTEGLMMWLLLQKAVQERRARSEAFRQMAEYLNRAWFRPLG